MIKRCIENNLKTVLVAVPWTLSSVHKVQLNLFYMIVLLLKGQEKPYYYFVEQQSGRLFIKCIPQNLMKIRI